MPFIEYTVGYTVDSPGEIEDIENRLRSTSPDVMALTTEVVAFPGDEEAFSVAA